MAAFLDTCRFNPTLGGTTDWTFSSAVTGCQSPTAAGVVNGRLYKYRAESSDLSQWEIGEGAYNTGTGVLARTTVLFNSAGTTAKISFSAAPQVAIVALKEDLLAGDETGLLFGMTNGTLVASASAGALTVAVKTLAGNDPSATDPVYFYFRNNTLTSGDYVRRAVTAALSVVIGSTKTMGVTTSDLIRLWISAHDNAGTVQIGAFIASDKNGIWSPPESTKFTTTVPDNTARAFHSTSAIGTAAPWRYLGYCEWTSAVTAGTWTAPDIVQMFGPGIKKPGDSVQSASTSGGATNTSSTTYVATTITKAFTAFSGANIVRMLWQATGEVNSATASMIVASFRDSTQLTGVQGLLCTTGIIDCNMSGVDYDRPNTTSSVTYAVKFKSSNGGRVDFANNSGSTAVGTAIVEELMA